MKSMSVARSTLALPLAVALLSVASWVAEAQGIERARKTVVYGSGFQLASTRVMRSYADSTAVADETNVVSEESGVVSDGDCATCGTAQQGCRNGCCMNVWDGYCEERRGCGWGCRMHRCKNSCCAPACDSCGCDGAVESASTIEGESKPTAQPPMAMPEAPKPALDRSASLRRVR